MKSHWLGVCLLGSLCGIACAQSTPAQAVASVQAAVPRLIRFSGQVKDASGTVGITFTLHKGQQDDNALWIETQNVQLDGSGKYTVLLGATKAEGIPTEMFTSGEAQWLGIRVENQPELPRVLLVSVPYALKAAEADTLTGHAPGDFITADKLNSAVQQQLRLQSASTPTVGKTKAVGTSTPTDPATNFIDNNTSQVVLVQQNGTGSGLTAIATTGLAVNAKSTSTAIYGLNTGTGNTSGVEGTTSSPAGRGVYGLNTATTGTNFGVVGSASSASGIGVFGSNGASSGTATGVWGSTSSTAGVALKGSATATTGSTTGVLASVKSAGGTAAVLQNTASGKLISGQYGPSNTEVFAVDFVGDISTEGYLNIGDTAPATYPISATTSTAPYTVLINNNDSTIGWGIRSNGPFVGLGAYANYYGLFGEAYDSGGYGVEGYAQAGNGVYGEAVLASYSAGYFLNSAGGGTTGIGLEAFSASGSASDRPPSLYDPAGQFSGPNGIIATSSSDSTNGLAVAAINAASNGIAIYGVNRTTGAKGIAIYGIDQGTGGTSYAGVFLGNVYISGTTTAPVAPATVIDHPSDPANKSLEFASVQSPDQLNVYNGNVTLDASGHATVALPAYFEQVGRDFRYQLTCIGGYAPVYIASKVQNNSFMIAGGTPGLEVSWTVTGVRNDKYAQAHPWTAEKEKPATLKGKYYSPELYGASAEQGIMKPLHQTDRVSPSATAKHMPSRPAEPPPAVKQVNN